MFVTRNIYIPEEVRCYQVHLDDEGYIFPYLLLGLQFVNRPYIIKGTQLLPFLQRL